MSKLDPNALCRTLLPGESSMPPKPPTPSKETHTRSQSLTEPPSRSLKGRQSNALHSALWIASVRTGTARLPFSQDQTHTIGWVFMLWTPEA